MRRGRNPGWTNTESLSARPERNIDQSEACKSIVRGRRKYGIRSNARIRVIRPLASTYQHRPARFRERREEPEPRRGSGRTRPATTRRRRRRRFSARTYRLDVADIRTAPSWSARERAVAPPRSCRRRGRSPAPAIALVGGDARSGGRTEPTSSQARPRRRATMRRHRDACRGRSRTAKPGEQCGGHGAHRA